MNTRHIIPNIYKNIQTNYLQYVVQHNITVPLHIVPLHIQRRYLLQMSSSFWNYFFHIWSWRIPFRNIGYFSHASDILNSYFILFQWYIYFTLLTEVILSNISINNEKKKNRFYNIITFITYQINNLLLLVLLSVVGNNLLHLLF